MGLVCKFIALCCIHEVDDLHMRETNSLFRLYGDMYETKTKANIQTEV